MTKVLVALGLVFSVGTIPDRIVLTRAAIHQTEPDQVVSVELLKLRIKDVSPAA